MSSSITLAAVRLFFPFALLASPVTAETICVRVSATGDLTVAGERSTLADLKRLLDNPKHVSITVDRNAPWLYVQWVAAAIAETRISRVLLRVDDKTITVPIQRGGAVYKSLRPVERLVVARVAEDAGALKFAIRSGAALKQRREFATIGDLQSQLPNDGQVYLEVDRRTRSGKVHDVLVALSRNGTAVRWPSESPHPWIREQRRLPAARRTIFGESWIVAPISVYEILPLSLPVAPASRPWTRKQELLVHALSDGAILVGMIEIRVPSGAAGVLRLELRRVGLLRKAAPTTPPLPLTIVLRLNRDLTWSHVRKPIAALRNVRNDLLFEFAATSTADVSCSPSDAKRLAVPLENLEPLPGGRPARRLPVAITTKNRKKNLVLVTERGAVVVGADGRRESIRDLSALKKDRPYSCWIAATERAKIKTIVAVISRLARRDKLPILQLDPG